MDRTRSKVWRAISQVRTVTAWLVIAAFVSMMIAETQIRGYPRPWPGNVPMPSELAWFIWWRNVSFLALLALILVSIPRWQSLAGFVGLVVYFVFFARM
jgi:hypothetical protein